MSDANDMSTTDTDRNEEGYQRPDGTPKKTGAEIYEHIARIRVDDTQAPNGRVAIHVEHPDHDGGVRCFFRNRTTMDVSRSIRSHLRTEINPDLKRVEIVDEVGVGLAEADLLPRRLTRDRPFSDPTTVEVIEA